MEDDPDPWYRSPINQVLLAMSGVVVALLVSLCVKVFRHRTMCPSTNVQFLSTEVDIVGYKCKHRLIYGLALVFSLALQILRSCLRVKEVQWRRDAMNTVAGSPQRKEYLGTITGYTFLGYTLYVISILFLVSKNLGILVLLLIGSMIGNVLAFHLQPADRFSVQEQTPPPL